MMLLNMFMWLVHLIYFHPFYLSVCEINYNPTNRSLEITHRIFANDLSDAISDSYGLEIEGSNTKLDSILTGYFHKHFKISLNQKSATITYVGSEVEEDVVWCYLEIKKVKRLGLVEIYDAVLMDEFEDQNNIVHVTSGEVTKSLKLDQFNKSGHLEFE